MSPSNAHIFKQETFTKRVLSVQTVPVDTKNKAPSLRNCAQLNSILIIHLFHVSVAHITFYRNTNVPSKPYQTYHNTYHYTNINNKICNLQFTHMYMFSHMRIYYVYIHIYIYIYIYIIIPKVAQRRRKVIERLLHYK